MLVAVLLALCCAALALVPGAQAQAVFMEITLGRPEVDFVQTTFEVAFAGALVLDPGRLDIVDWEAASGGQETLVKMWILPGDATRPPSQVADEITACSINGAGNNQYCNALRTNTDVMLQTGRRTTPPPPPPPAPAGEGSGISILFIGIIAGGAALLVCIGIGIAIFIWKKGSNDDLLQYAETGNVAYDTVETRSMHDIQSGMQQANTYEN